MPKPKILTTEFWTPRIDALTDNIGRAVRSGIQMVVAAIGASTFDVLDFDWKIGLSAFASGAVLSLLTSFVKPPVPPGGDPAVDNLVPDLADADADRGEIGLRVVLLVVALVLFLIVGAIGATWITSAYVFAFLGFGLAVYVLASLVP